MRTIKDHIHSALAGTLFQKIPGIITIDLVMMAAFWIHAFPTYDGVSPTLSLQPITTGLDIDYNNHCKLKFGEYVQVHEKGENTIMERSTGPLAMHRAHVAS